ncbi:hypothetical protein BDR04DRAFT_484324 [Suillus decipiens]|nr:hypothetical protein BDR04DRAFT_484324 [Suillus decipiens]
MSHNQMWFWFCRRHPFRRPSFFYLGEAAPIHIGSSPVGFESPESTDKRFLEIFLSNESEAYFFGTLYTSWYPLCEPGHIVCDWAALHKSYFFVQAFLMLGVVKRQAFRGWLIDQSPALLVSAIYLHQLFVRPTPIFFVHKESKRFVNLIHITQRCTFEYSETHRCPEKVPACTSSNRRARYRLWDNVSRKNLWT